ncbi:hypothetical protein C8Q73DRAFT_746107 [Cubamyces lactineus]|nr:hypothetical protein C8Q73DRAFT_746107 [Cubamyces lactineus]
MSPSILKLNKTNYAEWSMLMEAILVRKGLWDVASSVDTKPLGSPNTKIDLKMLHQARGFGTHLSHRRAFFQMAMNPDQSMSTWVGDVRCAAVQLTKISVNLTDEDCIVVLTGSLPLSYEQCVITLGSTPNESLTFDYVVNHLLNEESRQNPIIRGITRPIVCVAPVRLC